MAEPLVIVGIGQLGAVFAEGFLRSGSPVFPVLRGMSLEAAWHEAHRVHPHTSPLLLVAVGEDDLGPVLWSLPEGSRGRVILLQNELRPATFWTAGLDHPTACVVWFEKKPGRLASEVRPSVVFGRHSATVARALDLLGLHTVRLSPPPGSALSSSESTGEAPEFPATEAAHQLTLKNLYILGLNLTGLDHGGTARELQTRYRSQLDAVLEEVLRLERACLAGAPPTSPWSGVELDEARLRQDLDAAIAADPNHAAAGRSAPSRLHRTLAEARNVGLETPVLDAIAARHLP